MEYETILYTQDEGVLTVTLNRPDVLNAFNRKMTDEIQDALKKAERDASVRWGTLTGVISSSNLPDSMAETARL